MDQVPRFLCKKHVTRRPYDPCEVEKKKEKTEKKVKKKGESGWERENDKSGKRMQQIALIHVVRFEFRGHDQVRYVAVIIRVVLQKKGRTAF